MTTLDNIPCVLNHEDQRTFARRLRTAFEYMRVLCSSNCLEFISFAIAAVRSARCEPEIYYEPEQ